MHLAPLAQQVSWDCGPGYHKPLFGRCVPDSGVALVQRSRYAADHFTRPQRRLPAPIRSMGPWGPRVRY
ncbi:GCG_CRPN prefix-to-repeats domain-containing protein [Acidisphaera sp. L21]|uniref:GCG_CRPN prefix-to-repeats domain-containing protein n=1 Tax=Acidisphaera sp. L21 TaxID=1641851 RepID=UPI0038D2495F